MKEASENQVRGNNGEQEFAAWISRAGVFPSDPKGDYGVDFFCQLPTKKGSGPGYTMPGHVFAASVRSTDAESEFVLITRADAHLFLSIDMPMVLGLVKRGTETTLPSVVGRVVEEEFLREVATFLKQVSKTKDGLKPQESYSIRFETGEPSPGKLVESIRAHFDLGRRQKLNLLRKELRLAVHIANPKVKLEASSARTRALVLTDDFKSQFEITTDDTKKKLRAALFGKEAAIPERLAALPYKSGLVDDLRGLGDQVVVIGPSFVSAEGPFAIRVTNKECSVQLDFEHRGTEDWMAYVHPVGLSIQISKPIPTTDGKAHHALEVEFDKDVTFSDLWGSELDAFLDACTPDAVLHLPGNGCDYPLAGWPLQMRSEASRVAKWLKASAIMDLGERRIESITDHEFSTLRVLAPAMGDFGFIEGYGFAFGDTPWAALLQPVAKLWMPICGNLDGRGVVLWLEADGRLFKEPHSGRICGLKVEKVVAHDIELKETRFPVEGFPELKVCPSWPGIPMNLAQDNPLEFGEDDDWGVEMVFEEMADAPSETDEPSPRPGQEHGHPPDGG